MRLLICGDRNWTDGVKIANVLNYLKPTEVIEGDCRGADRIAGSIAMAQHIKVLKFPANWDKYGNGAGHIRNTQMLKEGKPELIGAFSSDIENSRGTANMLTQAEDNGVPYFLVE